MSENNKKNLLLWQRPNFTAIIYASGTTICRKKVKISRVLYEQIRLEELVQIGSSFGIQGHPRSLRMVLFVDRRRNFLYFLPTELHRESKKQDTKLLAITSLLSDFQTFFTSRLGSKYEI